MKSETMQLNIRVPKPILTKIKNEARVLGVSVSDVVRFGIKLYFKKARRK
jgi:hypothetical protein